MDFSSLSLPERMCTVHRSLCFTRTRSHTLSRNHTVSLPVDSIFRLTGEKIGAEIHKSSKLVLGSQNVSYLSIFGIDQLGIHI